MIYPRGRNRKRDPNAPKAFDACAHPKANTGKKTDEILKDIAKEKGIPVTRLLAYLIDNALDNETLFDFNHQIPKTMYEEGLYFSESVKIYNYLASENFPGGTDFEMLLLCRKDMGLETHLEFLNGYRELKAKGMIVETRMKSLYYTKPIAWVQIAPDMRLQERKNKRHKPLEGEGTGPLNDL